MGLEPPPFPRILGFRLVARDGARVEGDFPEGHGLGVRRERFDAWLLGRAREAGVLVHEGESFPNACDARWIVAADGLHSRFFTGRPDRPRRIGFSTQVRGLDVRDRVEIRFKKEGEVYLTPGEHDTQVAVLGRASVLRGAPGKDVIARFLGGAAEITAPVLGMGPLGRRVRDLVSGNVVATGDAAGAPDPITGEGMSLALRSAIRLADAIAGGDPRSYAAWRLAQGAAARGIGRRLLAMAPFANRVIARLERRPDFVRRFMRVAAGIDEPEALPLRAWIGLLL